MGSAQSPNLGYARAWGNKGTNFLRGLFGNAFKERDGGGGVDAAMPNPYHDKVPMDLRNVFSPGDVPYNYVKDTMTGEPVVFDPSALIAPDPIYNANSRWILGSKQGNEFFNDELKANRDSRIKIAESVGFGGDPGPNPVFDSGAAKAIRQLQSTINNDLVNKTKIAIAAGSDADLKQVRNQALLNNQEGVAQNELLKERATAAANNALIAQSQSQIPKYRLDRQTARARLNTPGLVDNVVGAENAKLAGERALAEARNADPDLVRNTVAAELNKLRQSNVMTGINFAVFNPDGSMRIISQDTVDVPESVEPTNVLDAQGRPKSKYTGAHKKKQIIDKTIPAPTPKTYVPDPKNLTTDGVTPEEAQQGVRIDTTTGKKVRPKSTQ